MSRSQTNHPLREAANIVIGIMLLTAIGIGALMIDGFRQNRLKGRYGSLETVCAGSPHADSPVYTGRAGVHPAVAFSADGRIDMSFIPTDAVAESAAETELVLCLKGRQENLIQSCPYEGNNFVKRYTEEVHLELREAASGGVVASETLTSGLPAACSPVEEFGVSSAGITRTNRSVVSTDQIKSWLSGFVLNESDLNVNILPESNEPTDDPEAWPIFLEESFSSNARGWFTGIRNRGGTAVEQQLVDGVYQWTFPAHPTLLDWFYRLNPPLFLADFSLVVDAQQINPGAGDSIGIEFRSNEQGGYLFLIQDNSFFALVRKDAPTGHLDSLIDWSTTTAPHADAPNQLAITAQGTHITLGINGQVVAEIDDDSFAAGEILFFVLVNEHQKPTSFTFDNIQLRTPDADLLTLIQDGEAHAESGEIDAALSAFSRVQELDRDFPIDPWSWNQICWYGALWERGQDVLAACERAISIAPEIGAFYGSRGVARAQSGDSDGAIKDFMIASSWWEQNNPESPWADLHKEWMRTLSAGGNPFDPETLARLRDL